MTDQTNKRVPGTAVKYDDDDGVTMSGRKVSSETAKIVIGNFNVVGVGDTLFRNASSQTYRWSDK
jgi:hypothetical protein